MPPSLSSAESETVADFANLAQSVLYWLAAGYYTAKEEAAILAATRKPASINRAPAAICEALAPPRSEPDDLDDADEAVEAAEAAEDAEIAAILEGPPPDVPPPAPNTTPDYTLHQFDQAVSALKQLMTKPAARFASTAHTTGDLRGVEPSSMLSLIDCARPATSSPVPAGESAR